MKIIIRGEKLEVTESIKNYAEEKIGRLGRYLESAENLEAHVLVKVTNRDQKVEVTIPLNNGILRAEERQTDLYAAIDNVCEKIERQIRKNKTKMQARKMKVAKDINFEYIEDVEDEEETSVVRRKKIEVKPMSEEEAIIQMELLGHQFYLYKDAETMSPTLVYKRKDGHYGVIETE